MEDYLDVSFSLDLKNKRERIIYRFFEILPAILSLGTLILAIFLSFFVPVGIAIFIIAFDVYWLLKSFYFSFYQINTFLKLKKNLKIDWMKKLKSLSQKDFKLKVKDWKEIYHLILLPMFKEGKEIVRSTLQSLVNCQYPKEKMIIILAIEERAGPKIQKMAKKIEEEFKGKFFKFLVTIHPQNIKGEIKGKGSNVRFAIEKAKEKIINPLKIPPEKIIVSIFDIDTRVLPQFFALLTYRYLTAKNPLLSSFQPIPLYTNNFWQAPFFSRLVASSSTFWQMIQQQRPEQLVTYSSHSLPFKVLKEISYPFNLISDDSRIFWKAYLYYNGNYKVVPLCYPVLMDAVLAKNLWRTFVNQYKQQRRWAWGCENIPYLLFGFLKNKKIPLFEKIRHSFIILEGFWSWATASLLIFILGWLPIILGGPNFKATLLSFNLPKITSFLMTLAMIGLIVSVIISLSLFNPPFKSFSRCFLFCLQWLFLPFVLIIFGSIPALEAQIRLMLKKPLGFWVTEKVRK